jgi:hypothetical protein
MVLCVKFAMVGIAPEFDVYLHLNVWRVPTIRRVVGAADICI